MLSTFLVQLLTVACALASPRRHVITEQDSIKAMPTKNFKDDVELYNTFQPKLEALSGCPSYPAVDEHGHVSDPHGRVPDCDKSHSDSDGQVYARLYEFTQQATDKKPNGIAIMYAWYFRDRGYIKWRKGTRKHDWQQVVVWLSEKSTNAQITKISYSTPNGYKTVLPPLSLENKTPLVAVSIENDHRSAGPGSPNGKKQPLVVWYSLPHEAWRILQNDKYFEGDRCPLADAEFDKHIMAASK